MKPALIVLAKEPVAGRVKTRCCPPCTPAQAAALAEAALADTLAAAAAVPHVRTVLALDGRPGHWLPAGVDVVRQRGSGLDERLAAAFDDVGGPAVLVGMDTPQVTADELQHAVDRLGDGSVDALLGPSTDGGFWAIGLTRPDRSVFVGVPMSRPDTGQRQLGRLHRRGLRVGALPVRTDVDDMATAQRVASLVPASRFARTVRAIRSAITDAATLQIEAMTMSTFGP